MVRPLGTIYVLLTGPHILMFVLGGATGWLCRRRPDPEHPNEPGRRAVISCIHDASPRVVTDGIVIYAMYAIYNRGL